MFEKHKVGYFIENEEYLIFFGDKNSSFDNFNKYFPHFKFIKMKQTHSNLSKEVKSTSDSNFTADAIYTKNPNLALCCITADCLPLLIFLPHSKSVFSIHAGWRGIQNKIIIRSLENFDIQDAQVFIGPHIGFSSFEVGNDVRDLILDGIENKKDFFKSNSENKSVLDLSKVAHHQLMTLGINEKNIHNLNKDTFKDSHFHSYRRDKETAGRQISFIVLKDGGSRRN